MNLRLIFLFIISLLVLPHSVANATTVPKMSFDELVEKSALVFRGKVVESDPTHFDDQRAEPVTKVTFDVLTVMYGVDNNRQLELFLPGGRYSNGEILQTQSRSSSVVYTASRISGCCNRTVAIMIFANQSS